MFIHAPSCPGRIYSAQSIVIYAPVKERSKFKQVRTRQHLHTLTRFWIWCGHRYLCYSSSIPYHDHPEPLKRTLTDFPSHSLNQLGALGTVRVQLYHLAGRGSVRRLQSTGSAPLRCTDVRRGPCLFSVGRTEARCRHAKLVRALLCCTCATQDPT